MEKQKEMSEQENNQASNIEQILAKKCIQKGQTLYQVKWMDYKDPSWVSEIVARKRPELIQQYEENLQKSKAQRKTKKKIKKEMDYDYVVNPRPKPMWYLQRRFMSVIPRRQSSSMRTEFDSTKQIKRHKHMLGGGYSYSTNYYFSAKNRFVPSAANFARPQSSQQQQQQQYHIGGTRTTTGSSATSDYSAAPGSYQEQVFFIANESKQSVAAPVQSAYTAPFAGQFAQPNRNSDFYDISPRPFAALVKRPGHSFQPQHINVPHQQTQFLAHFNEPANAASDKFALTKGNRLSNGAGSNAIRSFGSGGFTPLRTRPGSNYSNSNNEQLSVPTQQQQQQVPFRNTRNRFQPSSVTATTANSATTSAEQLTTSGKRFNRYGAAGNRYGGINGNRSTTTTKAVTTAASSERSSFGHTSKSSQRRPVPVSRELNEPVNVLRPQTLALTQRPYNGRIKLPAREQLLKQPTLSLRPQFFASSTTSQSIDSDYDESSREKENHVVEAFTSKHINSADAVSLEKLQLQAEELTTIVTTMATLSAEPTMAASSDAELEKEDHTVILTSNFYLPDGSRLETESEKASAELKSAKNETESSSASIEVVETETSAADAADAAMDSDNESEAEATTAHSAEYEYEYAEEPDTVTSSLPTNAIKTKTTAAETPEITLAAQADKAAVEMAKTLELPETSTAQPNTGVELKEPVTQKENTEETEYDEEAGEDDDYEYDEEAEGEVASDEAEEKTHDTHEIETATTSSQEEIEKEFGDHEIISVVTTKSVINGSTAYPMSVTQRASSTRLSKEAEEVLYTEHKAQPVVLTHAVEEQTEQQKAEQKEAAEKVENNTLKPTITNESAEVEQTANDAQSVSNVTEGYVVVASIQTSRSINGARFLPFPAIEQEETKQTLSELERKIHTKAVIKTKPSETSTEQTNESNDDLLTIVTTNAAALAEIDMLTSTETTPIVPLAASSTEESIHDKLDRVQSELSSGLLSGKYAIINQMDAASTPATSSTLSGKYVPHIRKFQPKSTTAAPAQQQRNNNSNNISNNNNNNKAKTPHFDDADMDELAGLLPVGFKTKFSYKNRKLSTTTSTTTEAANNADDVLKKPTRNATISRSFKNGNIPMQDVFLAGLLPKGYKANASTTIKSPVIEDIFSKLKFDDHLESLLPKDYKAATTVQPAVTLIDDITKFLPPGYKLRTTTTATDKSAIAMLPLDDISKFLSPGYKATQEEHIASAITPVKVAELSKFLPPDYQLNTSEQANISPDNIDLLKLLPKINKPTVKQMVSDDVLASLLPLGYEVNTAHSTATATTITTTTTTAGNNVANITSSADNAIDKSNTNSGFKVVFPKGIHKRVGAHRLTTPAAYDAGGGPTTPTVIIKKGPPTRATTEFTGWPTPSTTPISIEKLLEQTKIATVNFEDLLLSSSISTTTSTTTSTTSTTTPRPTKPGHCTTDCDLAATIKIIDGVVWKPELLDHNTVEWKNLAHEMEAQLNEVYSNAPKLSKWYKKVRIDSFSKGSVLVDYYVELANISQNINTLEIKKMFHEALTQPITPVVLSEKSELENETDSEDNDVYKPLREEKLVRETFQMGKYIIDPIATDFSVIPKTLATNVEFAEEDLLIPQWAIVVIVIGVGSLVFIIIFGVAVLLNRQKRAKKTPIPLTTDMLNELKVNHMGGADNYGVDDFYNIDDPWNDTKQPIKPKRFTNSMHGSNSSNIYDSWRSIRHQHGNGSDYFYDAHQTYSQKGDSLKRSQQQQQQQQSSQFQQQHTQHYSAHNHHQQQSQQQQQQQQIYGHQYPDAFADAHQMYTYNNHASRTRYARDYDPDY